MQKYAEEAVYEHVAQYLQPRFFKEKRKKKTAPFTNQLTEAEVNSIDVYKRQVLHSSELQKH